MAYSMKTFAALIIVTTTILMSACNAATPTPGIMVTPGGVIPEIVSAFDIRELGVGDQGWVALTNFTSEPGKLGGLFLCQGQECTALPDETVPSGETVRIAGGNGAGVDNVIAKNAEFGALKSSDGEIALTTSDNPQHPEQILFYLQWGSTPHALTDLAIEAGLWLKGGYAPTSAVATRLFRVPDTGLWLFEE
jgi:hypothetical protein